VWIAGLAVLASVLAFGALQRPALDRLTFLVFDAYQRLAPRPHAGAPVAVVDIDEASIDELGQWPWPRTTLAKLVDRLGELGAVTTVFDIVFPDPDRLSPSMLAEELRQGGVEFTLPTVEGLDNDATFGAAIAKGRVVVGIAIGNETAGEVSPPIAGFSYGGTDPATFLPAFRGAVVNLPVITEPAAGMGSFSFPPSADGLVRTMPLVTSVNGKLYPSLAVEALRVAQSASGYVIRTTGSSGEADTGRPAMVSLRVGDLDVPTGPDGQFWIYYSDTAPVGIPAKDLLSDPPTAAAAAAVAGKIVLIGTSALGLRDLVATPMNVSMPGVAVHAEIIDQIVGGAFLARPDWAHGAELLAAALLGVLLLAIARQGGALASSATALILIAVSFAASYAAFATQHLLLDPLLPALAVVLVFAVTMPLLLRLTDRERQFIRRAFDHYLAPALVERLAEDPSALALGGENRELSVLFTDIRGFTSLAERLDPKMVTSLLNGFLTPMTDVLLRNEATIDKYMGDAIMAFWNAPLDITDHRRKACHAALEMIAALDRLNHERGSKIGMGVGIHTDICCVGNLGSEQRFSYSAIGDGVNLASRVEGLTRLYGVAAIVTDAVRQGAPEMAFIEIDRVRVVGRAEPVTVYALMGDVTLAKMPAFRAFAADHEAFLTAYRALDAHTAERLSVARAHAVVPMDTLYGVYAERLAEMRERPPAPGWDGTFMIQKK
jgi:adenylate cyclase